MSAASDFAAAVQALAAAVQAATLDPADGIRLLAALADFSPAAINALAWWWLSL